MVGTIQSAIGIQTQSRIAFWDALIIASAGDLGCTSVWSEDLSPGLRTKASRSPTPLAHHEPSR
jgi:predicted nucleic acid-binding protein